MTERILVPLRYPITERGKKTIAKAVEVAKKKKGDLLFYHVNLLYEDKRVSYITFKKEVERHAEGMEELDENVSYSVENSYLLDESILKKITTRNIDTVIMGRSMAPRWKKFLKFWGGYMVTEEVRKAAKCKVIVVG